MKFTPEVIAALQTLKDNAENDFERHRIDVLEKDLKAPPVVEQIDDTHQSFNGVAYRKDKTGHYARHFGIHVAVWRYYYGDIPKGLEIHHRNLNPADNDIHNLQMLTKAEHVKLHFQLSSSRYICKNCGKPFYTKNRSNNHREFCSTQCRQKWYESDKTEKRICPVCGKTFYISKYERRQYCSTECSNKAVGIKNSTPETEKICPVCGKTFIVDKAHPNLKCCSATCGAKFGWQKSVRKIPDKTCPVCGKIFRPKESRIVCCSRSCGVRWGKLKKAKTT